MVLTPRGYRYAQEVRFEVLDKDIDSYRRGADFLNFDNTDVLCVQHEFGIYGGAAGSHVLALLKEVRMPVVTTLHTVLREPSTTQRRVMAELIARSDRLVVMAQKGAELLRDVYGAATSRIDVIPHGIPDVPFASSESSKAQFGVSGRAVLLTFGLLGPGKGIEHVIEALPAIAARHPDVVYVVLGATHPHLVAREGEAYRLSLERLARDRGVKDRVILHNRFVSPEDLTEFIGATDIYLTPYLNEAQITSGTLAYVFGAGKAVVSTPYWHAAELLADGRGVLVPFHDASAIAEGVTRLLADPAAMDRMGREAYRLGRAMIWPAVARQYVESFERARVAHDRTSRTAFAEWTLSTRPYELPPLRLDHVERMTDGTGMLQHAIFNVPNFHEGYCTDDNARAFLLCTLLREFGGLSAEQHLESLATRYLAFLTAAWNPERGRFRNFMSYGRRWLEDAGSDDSHGRALWALGVGAARSANDGHRRLCAQIFQRAVFAVEALSSPRAWAFTLLGYHERAGAAAYHDEAVRATAHRLTARLIQRWHDAATATWQWFESSVTYENARLSQALLLGGSLDPTGEGIEIGLASLRWLVSLQTTQAGHFRPIGSDGFYERDGARADFDQQPLEAQAMVSACLLAFRVTRDDAWLREARRAFEWFLGRNDLGRPLYDPGTGGCSDGLHKDRVSENQGAESSLAFHLALAELRAAEAPVDLPLAGAS